jgi:hypothetical protein
MMATSIRNSAALKYFHNQCTYPAFGALQPWSTSTTRMS